MRLRRVKEGGALNLELLGPRGWVSVSKCLKQISFPDDSQSRHWKTEMVALLGAPADVRARIAGAAADVEPAPRPETDLVIPFRPRSFRDFMLYEAHAIDAARGFVTTFVPGAARIIHAYEGLTGRTFPKLRPHALWYRQPLYYFGNHLNVVSDGEDIRIPPYTQALDYELELGFILAQPLRDATPTEAEAAIGGFVVLNDFSARDVQREEMASGFGPQKAKHFSSAISKVVVTADEILPRWRELKGRAYLNCKLISETSTAGARWTLSEVLAHASRGEQLHPGELFATGTLPGGSGIETGQLLKAGDQIEIAIEEIGTLSNRIV
jgi:2-keto-4-pentenoate hydratase/2-oxohepta-3-ene-1,7-dioic acid hydratase in catechol pathway